MKKVLAAVVSSLAIVALCVCFAACSTDITGTWKFSKMSGKMNGLEINYEVGTEINGVKISEDFVVLTINGDNTFEMKMAMVSEEAVSGKWEEKDGKYILSVEGGDAIEATLSGTVLSFEQEGMKLELRK